MKTYQAEIQSETKVQLIGNLKAINLLFKELKAHSQSFKIKKNLIPFLLTWHICITSLPKLSGITIASQEELSSVLYFLQLNYMI